MGTFMTAYVIVWLATAGYVAWLGVGQHRLTREIEELRDRILADEAPEKVPSKAA